MSKKLTEAEKDTRELIRRAAKLTVCIDRLSARREPLVADLKKRGVKPKELHEAEERIRAREARKREEWERYDAMTDVERKQWHAQRWEQQRAKWEQQRAKQQARLDEMAAQAEERLGHATH